MQATLNLTLAGAVAALLATGAAQASEVVGPDAGPLPPPPAHAQRTASPKLKTVNHAPPAIPAAEPAVTASANSGFATASAFASSGVTSNAQTLSPPVTITYNGTADAIAITQTGTGKAVHANIKNTSSTSSALYGATDGAGAGLTGYNGGTKGPAGKFGVTNAGSAQPGVFATTNGGGAAVLGTVTTAGGSQYPAVYGQNTSTANYGTGVEGDGNSIGVYGSSSAGTAVQGTSDSGYGMFAHSNSSIGAFGESNSSTGVEGISSTYDGVYGDSYSGNGVHGYSETSYGVEAETYIGYAGLYANNQGSGRGIVAHSASGIGVYSFSDSGYGIWGQSTNSYGIIGEDSGTGYGVWAQTASGIALFARNTGGGLAGYFDGGVQATSYVTTSDRNVKTAIRPVDGKDILARVNQIPVSSWQFKKDTGKEHIGPMAQDFHAAFGLDGDDDKHINLTDIAGVSLAAIQELSREVDADRAQIKDKDAQIAALTHKLETLEASFAARLTVLERQAAAVTQTASLTPDAR